VPSWLHIPNICHAYIQLQLKDKDVLPNINRTQAAERDKECRFLSLATLTFDLDLQTRPSDGPNTSSMVEEWICGFAVKEGRTNTHTTILQPFSRTTQVSQCQKKSSFGLYGANGDIRGRHTDHPAGFHSIRTNQQPTSIIPPFVCRIPFLPQPSQIVLACDRHQICWLAYPVAWSRNYLHIHV